MPGVGGSTVLKPSAWDPAGALWCTTLGGQGANDWPNSALYWPGTVTAGWSGTTLAKWTKMSTMFGRPPGGLRDYFYLSDIQNTTTNTGSAGNYGFFSQDHVTIMNTGAVMIASFFMSAGAGTDNYTSVTNGSHDADLDKFAQNLKRWHDDTANTAPIKKIILAYHHEPANDTHTAGSATQFIAAFRYIVSYLAGKNVGPGKPYDVVEWAYIDIATAYSSGSFYPGDDYVTWAMADPYNWGGGLVTPAASTSAGHMPTTGDSVLVVSNGQNTSGHYTDAWRSVKQICQPLLNWSDNHPTIHIGLTELGCSQDIRRYTVNGSFNLVAPQTHAGDPTLMTEWVTQSLNGFKGLASAGGTSSANTFTADVRMQRIQIVTWWNSQAQGPRWFNAMPVADGASTPGTGLPGGTTTHSTFDAFVTLVNDAYFTGSGNTGPTITSFTSVPTDTADQASWSLTVQMGTSITGTYSITMGDGLTPVTGSLSVTSGVGTASGTYIYAADGTYRETVTVTDGNSLTASTFTDVPVTGGTGNVITTPFLGLELWQSSDSVKTHGRLRWNLVESYLDTIASRWERMAVKSGPFTYSAMPSTVQGWNGTTTGAQDVWMDLTGFTKLIYAMTVSGAGASTARTVPAYSPDNGTTWRAFDSATSGTAITTGGAGPLTGPILSFAAVGIVKATVVTIPADARGPVPIRMYVWGGDGSTSPSVNSVTFLVQ